ncbi:MAG: lamin tail domain-containing protein [Chitinispirillaceae bacterium]|nr:lamin tail domain-containing protein [Chitinispirillaceae bacterium]
MPRSFTVQKKIPLYTVVLSVLSMALAPQARVIVSELYRDPPGVESDTSGGGGSHEFIELTNLGPDTFFITDLYVTNGLEADSVIPEETIIPGNENCRFDSRSLPPGMIALILDPDYRTAVAADFSRAFVLPDSTLLLRCGDREFGPSGLAGTHGVLLYRGSKSTIDSSICSASDEEPPSSSPTAGKIPLSTPENMEGISLVASEILSNDHLFDYCPTSISPGVFEPVRSYWIAEPRLGRFNRSGGSIPCTVSVLAIRSGPGATIPWQCRRLRNGAESVIKSGTISLMERTGTAAFSLPVDSAELFFTLQNEERPSWRIDLSEAWMPNAAIRITEIAPKATPEEPEWFELKNGSSMAINLKNWRFGRNDDTVTIIPTSFPLEPGALVVVTRDGALLSKRYRALTVSITPRHWITLDNSTDTIMLFDSKGTVRETVCYDDAWFSDWPYTSIERSGNGDGCSSASWSVAARPSPGLPNQALYTTGAPSLDIGPIPFTPDNDGIGDLLAIRMKNPPPSKVTITVYGFDGRAVKTFSGQPQEVLYWDGRTGSGTAAPPGPFFVVAEFSDRAKITRIRKKGILWRR